MTMTPRTTDRIYEQVKAMAVTFRLKPGDRVNEVELSRSLGVSRTPLREALNRLSSEGFLVPTTNRGYFVRPLDPQQVLTLYEFRAAVEAGALILACGRASSEAVEELAAFAERSRDMPDDDAQALRLLSLDEEFHERLAALSGNAEFVRCLRSLNERIRFIRWIDMQHRRAGTQSEHLTIVSFLRARDAEGATSLMRQHIGRRLDQITEMIRAGYAEIYTDNALAAHAVDSVA